MAERKRISSTSSNKKSAQNKKYTGKAAPNTKKTEQQSRYQERYAQLSF